MVISSWSHRLCIIAVAGGLLSFSVGRGNAANTTPTLMTIKVADPDGKPVQGAEVMVLPTPESGVIFSPGKWKAVSGSAATILADDVSTTPVHRGALAKYQVIARAPGFAMASQTVTATRAAETDAPEVDVKMDRGKPVTVRIASPDGHILPPDLKPWIVPKSAVIPTWMSLSGEQKFPGEPADVALGELEPDGTYTFNVAEDTPDLYLMINYPGFLRVWQTTDPLSLENASDQPLQLKLPQPGAAQVTFHNHHAESMEPGTAPCLNATFSTKMPGGGGWLVQSVNECNTAGTRVWNLHDLVPGSYYFSVKEGEVESYQSESTDVSHGTTATVTLKAHDVIPAVIAVGDNGELLPDAEGSVKVGGGLNSTSSWVKADDGVIQFTWGSMSGRYAKETTAKVLQVELRAPGYAKTSATLEAGSPGAEPVKVQMQRGRTVSVKFKSEDGRAIPADLKPVALAEEDFPRSISWMENPERVMSLGMGVRSNDDTYKFQLPNELKTFRVAVSDENFIRSYFTDPIEDFADGEVDVIIPRTGELQADVTLTSPPLKGNESDVSEKYIVSVTRSVKGTGSSSSSWQVTYDSITTGETTSVVVSNLPPGDYDLQVRPYRGEGTKEVVKVEADATAKVSVIAKPAGPMDEFGRALVAFPKVKVTGDDGSAVPGAQVIVAKKGSRYIPTLEWQTVAVDGTIQPKLTASYGESGDGTYAVTVRAPGYTTSFINVDVPTSQTEVSAALVRGTEVELQITAEDGRAVPSELRPSVFPESWGRDVWLTVDPERTKKYAPETLLSPFAVEATAGGRYTAHIDAESTEPLYVLINQPGFLRGFQAGPFDPKEWSTSKTVTIALPRPGSIQASFEYKENEKPESPVVTMELHRSQKVPGQNTWSLGFLTEELPATSATLVADDLASGSYSVSLRAAAKNNMHSSDVYSTRESAKVEAGSSHTVALKYTPFKKEWLQGPFTAMVTVKDQKDQPAAGKPYKVSWYETGYPQQTIAEGRVPEDGVIRLPNLAGVEKESTREDFAARGGVPTFDVEVDGQRLGYVMFGEYKKW